MAKVAKADLFIGGAPAARAGDLVDDERVKRYGWEDDVEDVDVDDPRQRAVYTTNESEEDETKKTNDSGAVQGTAAPATGQAAPAPKPGQQVGTGAVSAPRQDR